VWAGLPARVAPLWREALVARRVPVVLLKAVRPEWGELRESARPAVAEVVEC
jgi:hypothetical protein